MSIETVLVLFNLITAVAAVLAYLSYREASATIARLQAELSRAITQRDVAQRDAILAATRSMAWQRKVIDLQSVPKMWPGLES